MAKQVTNVERATVQESKFSLEREQVSLTCDDESEYVFERPADSPRQDYNLARRVKTDGDLSTSKGILPAAVTEAMDDFTERLAEYGIKRGWEK